MSRLVGALPWRSLSMDMRSTIRDLTPDRKPARRPSALASKATMITGSAQPSARGDNVSNENAPTVETHRFQAEVNQVLHLVIHSLYSHKEIFLRELISNASDALDKLRFRAITEPALVGDDTKYEIRIVPDAEKGTLTISDNGVGMTHDELTENLGTIARSGSRAFLEALAQKGQRDVQLIGQFGVGFYSAWLVADHVDVVSRAAGRDDAWRWSSDAKETYTLEADTRASRGTDIVLHLRDDQKEFLEDWRLRELVTKYSDYVSHPIQLGTKKEGATELSFETLNRANAIWQRPKSEVTEEQYADFYKHLTHDNEAPLAHTHFRVEGTQQFVGLLFVRRVFIMDQCEEILPTWLRFVRGVVDSDDLPLNVSRETLQDSATVRAIKKQVVKRSLDLLEDLAKNKPDQYVTFWKAFGAVLKEGLAQDWEYREKLSSLVRYESTLSETPTSLADYVSRMRSGQDAIYYVFGESRKALEQSPHLEALRSRGYEVLFMTDPIDEWAAEGIREFQGKKLVSAMRADLALDSSDDAKKDLEARAGELKGLLEAMKSALGERVSDVRVSDRLTDSPACLVVPVGASHAYLEKLLKESGREVSRGKRVFEVNPKHPLIENLRALHAREPEAARTKEWIEMLYDQAVLTEGSRPEDPNAFAKRLTALLTDATKAAAAGGPMS
jgi:molecular chaperone HtpG